MSDYHCVKTVKNTVNFRIQSKRRKIRTRKIFAFGHFSRSLQLGVPGTQGAFSNKVAPDIEYFTDDSEV